MAAVGVGVEIELAPCTPVEDAGLAGIESPRLERLPAADQTDDRHAPSLEIVKQIEQTSARRRRHSG